MSDEWKLVPIEPTAEMIAALGFGDDAVLAVGHGAISVEISNAYSAMLSAAPEPPDASEPYYYYANCGDSDYSCLCNNYSDAVTQVADHGGEVVRLWNTPPDHNIARLEASYQTVHEVVAKVAAERDAALAREEFLKAELAWSENDSRNQSAKIEALQLLLNTADQRNADAVDLMRRALVGATAMGWDQLERDLMAFIADGHVTSGPVEAGDENEVDLTGLYAGSKS